MKVLFVDLRSEKARTLEIEPEYKHIKRGLGLALSLVREYIPHYLDPLDPDNALIIAASTLSHVSPTCLTPALAVFKSPLTSLLTCARLPGQISRALRALGYDALCIVGRHRYPIVLFVNKKGARIRVAVRYWALNPLQVNTRVRELNKTGVVLAIGRAGERLVRYACAYCNNAIILGSTGLGCVMGSKNLKALVFEETSREGTIKEEIVCPKYNYADRIYPCGSVIKSDSGKIELPPFEPLKANIDVEKDNLHDLITTCSLLGLDVDCTLQVLAWIRNKLLYSTSPKNPLIQFVKKELEKISNLSELARKISEREGIGAILAEGAEKASHILGVELDESFKYYYSLSQLEFKLLSVLKLREREKVLAAVLSWCIPLCEYCCEDPEFLKGLLSKEELTVSDLFIEAKEIVRRMIKYNDVEKPEREHPQLDSFLV